jgi:DNA-binding NarL/FixJ family response regulator
MLYGEALKHLLQIGNAIHVVGVAGDCRETMDKYLTFRPQVLVVDALLPPQGVNGLRPLLNYDPPPKIILLTSPISGAEAGMFPEAQVFGFQLDCNSTDLRRTVRSLTQGTGQPLHSKVAEI